MQCVLLVRSALEWLQDEEHEEIFNLVKEDTKFTDVLDGQEYVVLALPSGHKLEVRIKCT